MQPKKKQKLALNEDYISNYTPNEFLKIQLHELYEGIHHAPKTPPDLYINTISTLLTSLKPSKKQNLLDAFEAQKAKKTKWPLFETFEIPNGCFKFLPPTKVVVVGGAASGAQFSSDTDCLIVVPSAFYEQKDYLNGRYVVKRALYLLHIIPKIKKLEFVASIKFKFLNNDFLKAVISLRTKCGKKLQLIPCTMGPGILKPALLKADKNCLRPNKVFLDSGDCEESPTPFYNNSILSDILPSTYLEFLGVISHSENFRKALVILKFWCKQKALGQQFNGYIMTHIMLLLFSTSQITINMDVLTILKQIWSYLATKFAEAVANGVTIGDATAVCEGPGMFCDTLANLLYNVDSASIVELSRYSKIMTECLHSNNSDMFLSALTEETGSMFDVYDVIFTIDIPEKTGQMFSLQYCGVGYMGSVDQIKDVLKRAYGDRITHIRVWAMPTEVWSRVKRPINPDSIIIGLNVEKDTWTRQVERGPSADTPESRTFKEFWGDKSTLRRFQDGSIVQAVVWDSKTVQDRRGIVTQITKHMLSRHLDISAEHVHELKFESSDLVGREYYLGDGEEQAQKIIQSFTDLSRILRSCSKIPLSITSIQGVSPVLRHTDLYPQREYDVKRSKQMAFPDPKNPCSLYNKPHEMVCHFELTGKWPEDVRGIIRLKTAFYLALKEELESLHILAKVSPDFLDIARNGFVFRLCFYVPKEAKLRSSNISFWMPCSGPELTLQTETVPAVSSLLSSFSRQYSAFPLTVRYLKRWVCSHNLSNYIPDIFCELVVAHVFINNQSFSVPQTETAGFFRTLSFISSFDWSLYPLLININDDLTTETYEMYNNFINTRKSYPDACIVCPRNELSALTQDSPTKTSLNIVKVLAKQSLKHCHESLQHERSNFDVIFTPDTAAFNVVIHLKSSQTAFTASSNPVEHHAKSSHFPVVDYSPVQYYVEELTAAYKHLCLFFYNAYNPQYIGVVVRQTSKNKFTVNTSKGKVPSEDGFVTENLDAMISDFDLMGKGLVKNIEIIRLDM